MNSGYYPLIIMLLYVAVHVFGALTKEAAKRKEQQRKKEELEQRRVAAGRLEAPAADDKTHADWRLSPSEAVRPADRTPTPAPARPASVRLGKSLDELAARRKEQLDQLRARRDVAVRAEPVQTGKPPEARLPSGTFSPPAQQAPAQPPPTRITAKPQPSIDQARRRQDAKARLEQQARARAQQEQRAASAAEFTAATEAVSSAAYGSPGHVAQSGDRYKVNLRFKQLKRPAALRELMILKEIIDPPISLR